MLERADAHLHFFYPGYVATLPETCRRVQPDEVTLYAALAEKHGVRQVLAVAYEGSDWAAGNNDYVASLAAERAWIRPVAFVHDPAGLSVERLENWQQQRFVGLSLYLFSEEQGAALRGVPAEVWTWLVQRRWLLSVNSRGEHWRAWPPVLEQHPDLRVVVSHLGLPPAVAQAPDAVDAAVALKTVLALAKYPGPRVKLSGFYALTQPGYDYPHRAAWPYVLALMQAFGVPRLLWGSDYSPCLEHLSFPQTFGLFAAMPFLGAADRPLIEGGNLLALLADVDAAP